MNNLFKNIRPHIKKHNFLFKSMKLFEPTQPAPLGRWEHRLSENTKLLKSELANKDNCGDRLCQTPTKNN